MRVRRKPYLTTNWARGEDLIWPAHEGIAEMDFETELTIKNRSVWVHLEQVAILEPDGE